MSPYPWLNSRWAELAAQRENSPHALLIHRPLGVGKLALARRFAQLILCETATVSSPCGHCEGCRWFMAGQHPDFRQIEPEALAAPVEPAEDAPAPSKAAKPSFEIKVEQVRELAGFLNIGSHRARRRVAVFHPAENMNSNSANALLKSLEEPASGACFILISNKPQRLLATVRSRCVSLPIGMPMASVTRDWLRSEKVEDAEDWLAYAGGAPLLARSLADSTRGGRIRQLTALLRANDRDGLLAWNATDREDIEMLAEVLQKWACDQAFLSFSGKSLYFNKIPQGNGGRSARDWLRFAREAGQFRRAARHPLNPKLFAAEIIGAMPRS